MKMSEYLGWTQVLRRPKPVLNTALKIIISTTHVELCWMWIVWKLSCLLLFQWTWAFQLRLFSLFPCDSHCELKWDMVVQVVAPYLTCNVLNLDLMLCSKSFDSRSWNIGAYTLSSVLCVQVWSARLLAEGEILWCLKHFNS
jgi:hypothetical protein